MLGVIVDIVAISIFATITVSAWVATRHVPATPNERRGERLGRRIGMTLLWPAYLGVSIVGIAAIAKAAAEGAKEREQVEALLKKTERGH